MKVGKCVHIRQKLNRDSRWLLIYGGKTAVDFSDQLQAISWNEISSVF
jgi:hypothetical protein